MVYTYCQYPNPCDCVDCEEINLSINLLNELETNKKDIKQSKYDIILMKTAKDWSELSSCQRRQVGCVIAKDDRIIVNSYNGTVKGSDNCCEHKCTVCNGTGSKPDKNSRMNGRESCENCQGKGIISNKTVVHAEANAILYAAKEGIALKGCSIYITLSPCIECSKMIIQSGIIEVFYETEYKDLSGVEFLKNNGVIVNKI